MRYGQCTRSVGVSVVSVCARVAKKIAGARGRRTEVEVRELQVRERLGERARDLFGEGGRDPELGRDEHVLALAHAAREAVGEALADLALVAVRGRAVNVADARLERGNDGRADEPRRGLPRAEPDDGWEGGTGGARRDGYRGVGCQDIDMTRAYR